MSTQTHTHEQESDNLDALVNFTLSISPPRTPTPVAQTTISNSLAAPRNPGNIEKTSFAVTKTSLLVFDFYYTLQCLNWFGKMTPTEPGTLIISAAVTGVYMINAARDTKDFFQANLPFRSTLLSRTLGLGTDISKILRKVYLTKEFIGILTALISSSSQTKQVIELISAVIAGIGTTTCQSEYGIKQLTRCGLFNPESAKTLFPGIHATATALSYATPIFHILTAIINQLSESNADSTTMIISTWVGVAIIAAKAVGPPAYHKARHTLDKAFISAGNFIERLEPNYKKPDLIPKIIRSFSIASAVSVMLSAGTDEPDEEWYSVLKGILLLLILALNIYGYKQIAPYDDDTTRSEFRNDDDDVNRAYTRLLTA